ncbi:MAG: hypothetical protein AVO33_01965 [delta proteobacterium ML8_F1]|nr:MAG: hypothetical protein AVO33_01965 [delta proteobacterium ML8_F1]
MKTIEIEKITLPYDKELLLRWKDRDQSIVPTFMLGWNGPGISNGYGFGEWMAAQYFRNLGYYVFANEFDFLSDTTKFRRYNEMIKTIIDFDKREKFNEAIKDASESGFRIENPDLFVFNLDTCFFAEVKKDKNRLREPQMRFFYLAKKYLGIDSRLVYLCDQSKEIKYDRLTFEFV